MKSQTKQTFKIFWQHATRYKALMAVVAFGVVGATAGRILEPFLYKRFFDNLASPMAEASVLIQVLWMVLALNAGVWILHRIEWIANNRFQSRVKTDLLNTCFGYLHLHSFNFFNNNFAGSLVRKVNKYDKAFEEIADQISGNLGVVLVRVLLIVGILTFRSPALGLIILAWLALFGGLNYWFAMFKMKFDMARTAMDTKVTGQLADTIANNLNLKIFGGYGREVHSFETMTAELHRVRRISWDWGHVSEAIQGALMTVLEFAVMYTAVRYWQRGLLTVGDFALLQAYLIQLFQQLWQSGRYIRRIYESIADANEMTEILTTPHDVRDKPRAAKLKVETGAITFQDVGFWYHQERPVFERFDFTIAGGQRVAIIGPSGGGKSTIVKLLFRFFDIQKGKVLIDGQDIADVTQESLRKSIALVPQEPILFHRSLLENIRYAKPGASKQEVIEAARLAHCHEFISRFPEQYDTFVGERGVKLSGGERQRVAIARAILKNAPILVLDEATSSLDSESEQFIQDALKKLMKGKTTIVIAHRLSTIMQMDRIVVIEDGAITEEGKHEELLKAKQGTYQKLWEIQAGGFA